MTVNVDVVIVGIDHDAVAAALAAARSGKRVLVMTAERGSDQRRRVRDMRRAAGERLSRRIRVLSGVQVECVAGIRSVEAVLARVIETGRRIDINAASIVTFEESNTADR